MTTTLDQKILDSRLNLKNPYAHLDEDGYFTALDLSKAGNFDTLTIDLNEIRCSKLLNKTIPYSEIENVVRNLHRHLWTSRELILGKNAPVEPTDMLDPALVFNLLGYKFDGAASLGQYRTGSGMAEIAGYIDPVNKYVGISNQYRASTQSFTAAHELGHAVLHGNTVAMHRDRPLHHGAPFEGRDHKELEADKFATYFLMPKKLVTKEFTDRFFDVPFEITDDTAFLLTNKSKGEFKNNCQKRRDLAKLLAECGRYGRYTFVPLANQFNVSTEAMAIRIEQLDLLAR